MGRNKKKLKLQLSSADLTSKDSTMATVESREGWWASFMPRAHTFNEKCSFVIVFKKKGFYDKEISAARSQYLGVGALAAMAGEWSTLPALSDGGLEAVTKVW
mgnify:CR=1 FL=1